MKYIVLSFDDGRKDFYTNALPILKKYGFSATVNIVSDYMGKSGISEFPSGNGECLSWEEAKQCQDAGIEIACHSANHTNSIPEILRGCKEISAQTGNSPIGFASPFSAISEKNFHEYKELANSQLISYIRSGNQLKRDGYFNILLYFLYKYTKSSKAFVRYNRRNILPADQKTVPFLLPSVTCNRDNTVDQLIALTQAMPNNTGTIIMFHSILNPKDPGFGQDKWFNTTEEFDRFCRIISSDPEIQVITTQELVDLIQ